MDERGIETSSSTALCWLSPPHICVPYREAFASFGDTSSRLLRRFAFVERALQVFVAVLMSEARALGIPSAPPVDALLGKLSLPSMGLWAAAGAALAEQLEGSPSLVAPELARALARPADSLGSLSAADAANRLVYGRNRIAHNRAPDPEALAAEMDPHFVRFLVAVEAFSRRPVLVITKLEGEGRLRTARIIRFRGPEPEELPLDGVDALLPVDRPLLVADDGRVCSLAPWMLFKPANARPELRLLTGQERGRGLYEGYGAGVRAPFGPPLGRAELTSACEPIQAQFTPAQAAQLNIRPSGRDPERVGPYEILGKLGSGGSGRLYLARAPGRPGEIAMKVLHADLLGDEGARQRLEHEFKILRSIDRRDIVRVHEHGEDSAVGAWIAMELVEGEDLSKRLGSFPVHEALRLVDGVLGALQFLHDRGVVHRDIKPSNVLLRADGQVVLIDLGVATGGATLTRTGVAVGTDRYGAPEQRRGEKVDDRADLYAVARLLGALVGGEPDARELGAKLPPAVLAVWRQALMEDPADRFASAEAMRGALVRAGHQGADGCPVSVGQALESVRIQRVIEQVQPGVWAFSGVSTVNAAAVGGLVAVPGGAAGALSRALLPFGELSLSVDPSGLHVVRVRAGEELRWAKRLFSEAAPEPAPEAVLTQPPAAPPRPAPEAPEPAPAKTATPGTDWKTAAAVIGGIAGALGLGAAAAALKNQPKGNTPPSRAPYLKGLPGPLRTSEIPILAALLHQLGLILCAQAAATGEVPLSAETWLGLEALPLGAASRILRQPLSGGPVAAAMALVPNPSVQVGVVRALHEARLGKHKLSAAELLAAQKLGKALGEAIIRVGPQAPEEKLAPYLRESDGKWQFLSVREGKFVYLLLKPAFAFP